MPRKLHVGSRCPPIMASRLAARNGGMVNGVSKTPFLIGVAGGTASGKVRKKLQLTTSI